MAARTPPAAKPRKRPYQDQVAAGVALLTKRKPTWRKKIDPHRLCMSFCTDCILGQAYGDYWVGLTKVFRRVCASMEQASAHGFTVGYCRTTQKNWRQLQDEWLRQLTEVA